MTSADMHNPKALDQAKMYLKKYKYPAINKNKPANSKNHIAPFFDVSCLFVSTFLHIHTHGIRVHDRMTNKYRKCCRCVDVSMPRSMYSCTQHEDSRASMKAVKLHEGHRVRVILCSRFQRRLTAIKKLLTVFLFLMP